ncbi:olfactory receptor 13A1-like [Trachemys scripta elegans]|uniref:olfactory receptor 13A1-like n=1 Tax=Trachemys scripta elegans TaxID=31138 RepID=UPI001557937A|nr:olfactory receptor 13A1-like [Trachemys scripta elegans]
MKNQSSFTEFILVGLSSFPEHQMFLFVVFIFIYMAALTGNLLIVLTITTSSRLHTPMYILLINLSLINLLSISVSIPKMLHNLLEHRKTIALLGCIAQIYLFTWTLVSEVLVLAAMAFDRYIAICHPLHYTIIMRKEVCVGLIAGIWIIGVANSAVHTGLVLQLSFFNSNIINHFFCELPPFLKLSCSDTSLNETLAFLADAVFGVGSCVITLMSYFFILRTILKIRSTEGKKKAFSTCSSHLIVVILYYSTAIYTYIHPSSAYSPDRDKVITVLYSVITPALNPIIYSLRNNEVKEALRKLISRLGLFQRQ